MKSLNLTITLIVMLTFTFSNYASTFNSLNSNQSKIKVTTNRITKIKETQAECTYKVEGTATEKGVCISDTPSPTINHKKVTAPANAGNPVTSSLNGLKEATKYYVRAYAKSGSEVIYGNELNFTTLPKGGDSKPSTGPKKETKPETPKK
ncbi:MAG: hypothetical protein AB7S72_18820 [Draconibacterium sp.]